MFPRARADAAQIFAIGNPDLPQLTPSTATVCLPPGEQGRDGIAVLTQTGSQELKRQGCVGRFRGHGENNAVRRLLLVLAALAIVATSFFVTLRILNSVDTPPKPATPAEARDATRRQQISAIKAGLEKYKAEHGKYPELPDNDVSDLQRDLVGGGYLAEIPRDPSSGGPKAEYPYASNGKAFGLLVRLEAGGRGIQPGGMCLSRAKGDHNSSFWNNPPECPF